MAVFMFRDRVSSGLNNQSLQFFSDRVIRTPAACGLASKRTRRCLTCLTLLTRQPVLNYREALWESGLLLLLLIACYCVPFPWLGTYA